MISRRGFLGNAAVLASATAVSGRVQAASIPEAPSTKTTTMQSPIFPTSGPNYQPVVTLNGWTLPWRMNGDWKEFHLVAEPVVREFAPGMKVNLWGYNGQAPGPTIEAVEGDKVRIFVTNKLPEHTTVHWHGMLLPNGMDGVGGVTQPHIDPGKTFVYEFEMKKSGTFMYHPHSDEMVPMAMGMMGMFVVHPRDPKFRRVHRDFVFIMSAYLVDPGTYLPKVAQMTDFNMWTWNSRVFPGIDPIPVRLGDRVRVRMGNLTMTNHPLPMMTGFGQFGPIEMGGMFTLMKIREGLARNDYSDATPFQHPPGTVAYEVKDAPSTPVRRSENSTTIRPGGTLKAVKP